jgi:hypothetical protein
MTILRRPAYLRRKTGVMLVFVRKLDVVARWIGWF